MSILDFWYLLRERWLTGLLAGIALGSLTAFLILRQPTLYESVIQFDLKSDDKVFNPLFDTQGDRELQAHVTKVTSQNFFDHLAGRILLNPELSAALNGEQNRDRLIGLLNRSVRASRVNDFVTVRTRNANPEVAADLANEIGVAYRLYDESAKAEELKNTESTLEAELDNTRKALDEVNRKLFELGRSSELTGGELDLPARELIDANSRIAPLEADIREQEQVLETVRMESSLEKKLGMSALLASGPVQAAAQEYRSANADMESLIGTGVGKNHPDLIDQQRKADEALRVLETTIATTILQLETRLKVDRKELQRLKDTVDALNDRIAGRSEYAGEYGKMETQRDQLKQRMKDHQNRIDDIRLQSEAGLSTIEPLDRALANYRPVSPDKRLAILASLAVFSSCLIGLPISLGLLDTRLKSISEVEKFLGIDCLATIPAKKTTESEDLGLAVLTASDEAVVESFRVLYSSLRMISHNDSPHSLLVTSSAPSEGKSFITTNLAAFFAEQGKRTLIIDCDFRKPTQHRNVKETNDQGMIRWYHSDEPVPQNPDEIGASKALGFLALGQSENLYLLRAGGTSKSPTAMIESTRFAQLIHTLRSYFDFILFDTPPVGLFPDALFVADYTDESIFVSKFRGLHRHKVKFALSQLQKAGCNVLGVVVNYLTTRASTGYGYGYSDYGYGHYSSKDYARYYSSSDSK